MSPSEYQKYAAESDLKLEIERAQGLESVHKALTEKVLEDVLVLEESKLRQKLAASNVGYTRFDIGITRELFTEQRPIGAIGLLHERMNANHTKLLEWAEWHTESRILFHVHAEEITYHVMDNIPLAEIRIVIDKYVANRQPVQRRYSEVMTLYDTQAKWISGDGVFLEWVEQRAWQMKAELIAEIMHEHAFDSGYLKTIVFVDGPLMPQTQHKTSTHEKVYLDLAHRILLLSMGTGVPIVGHVAQPRENYLSYWLAHIDTQCTWILTDMALLRGHLLNMQRTPMFRRFLHNFLNKPYPGCDLGFVYMQVPIVSECDATVHTAANPVRLEFPIGIRDDENPYPLVYDVALAHLIRLQLITDSDL